ncbi:WD-REPEATS-REGION domain-containing protein [Mycena indigotica]|uniref:WD-REPEATS-REGION domain-containing protein n=1 Tax=Mycena indigotica TaxID=2126181 RepID=A0A8H6T026_9AGAR|nr:WD-REPEATS-REGION domain-containing protein [Mycena indigotica]KAF7307467.1 WD-REPEATS-REGION domain-containing protein [Mycena indigotica]
MSNPVWNVESADDDSTTAPRQSRASTQAAALQALLGPLLQRQGAAGLRGLTIEDLNRLLTGEAQLEVDGDDDDDDEEDDQHYQRAMHAQSHRAYFKEVKDPQEAGVNLIHSGDFGRVGPKIRARDHNFNIARTIRARASQARPRFYREDYTTGLVPNSSGTTVAEFDANVYTAQYSADSSFFYTCSQDFRLNIFDTTVPVQRREAGKKYTEPSQHLKTNMALKNSIQAYPGRWTITDANLSRDNERMVYASMSSTCYMTSTTDPAPTQIPIPFADPPGTHRPRQHNFWGFDAGAYRIYSCRFSADGQEIIAGGNGQIFVYDLLANRRAVKIEAHTDDVNSCCWADTASGNVLVSASDDSFLKVWDRRSLGASQTPSGVLMGHTEGITYVSAKGDGRYVISNGKDQKLRLWDLRKMRTNAEFEEEKDHFYGTNYDYRYPHYPKTEICCTSQGLQRHDLPRPAETTGGQYIYSGSADGKVHIWSLDGRVVQVLDRTQTFAMSFDPSEPEPAEKAAMDFEACVRDVSWHSQEPVLMSAAWEGGRGGSRVARHEWKGLSKMGGKLEDWVERERTGLAEANASGSRRSTRLAQRRMPGTFTESEGDMDSEDDEEEDVLMSDDDEDWEP